VLAGFSYETTRKARWVADSLLHEPIPHVELTAPRPLEEPEVSAIHDPVYVQSVRTGQPRSLAESQGFRWDPQLFTAVLASNGGAVEAALRAFRAGGAAGSLSSGLHHAHRTYGLGNCTFNGLALAAHALLTDGAKNVLLLDLDAHCGGGTNELVAGDPRVWHVDVAVHPFDRYTPAPRQTLDLVQDARHYLPTVERRLDHLAVRGPALDVVLYNAGMDPHERSPVGGLPGITREVLEARERIVFQWCRDRGVPIAFVLAGGYMGPGLDERGLTDLHRLTVSAAQATFT
jgi:acetoin utilization deacetylase AcuC-like enzyme